jgi:hypothetical protein
MRGATQEVLMRVALVENHPDPSLAESIARCMILDGHEVEVVGSPNDLRLLGSLDAIILSVQAVVGDRDAYLTDTYDLDALAVLVMHAVEATEAKLGVYASIPNRAHDLIGRLAENGVRAEYVEYCDPDAFEHFLRRDAPVA